MQETTRNVEDVLESAKTECLRHIIGSELVSTKKAWYYTHCGEIEMAFNLGLISQERFNKLRADWRDYQPT